MLLKPGDQCPAYSLRKAGERDHCYYCKGCGGFFKEGIVCNYSLVPTHDPKFNVGDMAYFNTWHDILEHLPVRKIEWHKFGWQYYAKRKQTPLFEDRVFATRKEGDTEILKQKLKQCYKELMEYKDRYGELPEVEHLKLT